MYYDLDDTELFLLDVGEYVETTTNMKSYLVMPEEKREKYVTKVVLDITRQCSPKANYGVTRDVLRAFVIDVLASIERKHQ
ncbi:hypothetical protein [Paenisporosarcina sp. NPDC076898]|uniref:hypothetical protein n=1 Tax=unclassified Paenisporosarcina TaxID=2642018 RepID=UPI003D020CD8